MLFTSATILDSVYKCHYNVYASVTMCQQLLTVNLDVELNRSKCNLSLEPKIMTVHKSIQVLQLFMGRGYKWSFGVSECPFWKRLDINLDKTCVKHSFSKVIVIKFEYVAW